MGTECLHKQVVSVHWAVHLRAMSHLSGLGRSEKTQVTVTLLHYISRLAPLITCVYHSHFVNLRSFVNLIPWTCGILPHSLYLPEF